ncbi:MAG TPA: methyltransferase domain-containing protein [Chryseosolibacter sp.]
MPDLTRRATENERMDDLQSSGEDLYQALRELDTINYLLGGNKVTLAGLDQLMERLPAPEELHIADLGCGSGDMLKRIRRRMDKRKRHARLTGIDANPSVIAYAESHTSEGYRISYEPLNIFSPEFGLRKFDIITASLFFHHFTSEELTEFFRQLKNQLRIGFVINDIHRHWFSYHSIKLLTGFFSRSQMVKNDAPLSVLRAFKKNELSEILERAGILHYSIKWRWAFRWQVVARIL